MTNSKNILILIFLVAAILSNELYGKDALADKKVTEDAKFLQVDEIDIPIELKKIEDQIKENAIDVIIYSKTHSPVFAQKRQDGYSESYKNFYGLQVRILPISNVNDFYSLQLLYFNWTTNKFDKRLKRQISKYNVLNELRFAVYEVINGESWVKKNRDKIERENFDRIQAVRKALVENKQIIKKKMKKELEEIEKLKEKHKEEEEFRKKNKLKREEEEKIKSKKIDIVLLDKHPELLKTKEESDLETTEAENNYSDIGYRKQKNQIKEQGELSRKKNKEIKSENHEESFDLTKPNYPEESAVIPIDLKKIEIYTRLSYFQESVSSKGEIGSTTSLKYVGIGGDFVLENITKDPIGIRLRALFGMPLFKEEYPFPIYRSIEMEYYKAFYDKSLKLYSGLDFSPTFFVNLPVQGEGLQVIQNDFLWLKLGVNANTILRERLFSVRLSYYKSLVSKSNKNLKTDADKISTSLYVEFKKSNGIEINYQSLKGTGQVELDAKLLALSYIYQLEN